MSARKPAARAKPAAARAKPAATRPARAKRVVSKVARTQIGTIAPSKEGSASRVRNKYGELCNPGAADDHDPQFPMPDETQELFCACMAEGHSPGSAARTAGLTESYGYRLMKRDSPGARIMRARIDVLRRTAVSVLPSAAALFNELHGVAKEAMADKQYKVASEALKYLHASKERVERETLEAEGQDVTTRLTQTRVARRFSPPPDALDAGSEADEQAAEEEARAMAELDGMLGEDPGAEDGYSDGPVEARTGTGR